MKRFGASVLSLAIVVSTVPPVGAAESVVGTIQVSGPAWVASPNADWSRLSSTRPLVAGDRLKTGSDGYLLADLGDAGVVGLYGDAEVATNDQGAGPVVDVHKGKVAFHIAPNSRMKLNAQGAAIASGERAADGYVEYDSSGVPVVVVEDGSLNVQLAAGNTKTVARGERLALGANGGEPIAVAQADEDVDRKAGAAASGEGTKTYAGLSATGWTAVAVVAGAIGGAAYYASDDDDGGDDDSPSGD
jgi:hypothetical protein